MIGIRVICIAKYLKTNRNGIFLSHVCTPEWNAGLDKGKPFKQGVEELLPLYPQYAEEIKMYDARWEEMCGDVIEGSVRLLRSAARHYPVYGLTNWSEEKFAVTRPKHDFFNLFKGIVVSGIEKESKPDPVLFEILIRRYGLDPEKRFLRTILCRTSKRQDNSVSRRFILKRLKS